MAYALIFGYKNNYLLGTILMAVPLVLIRLSQKQYIERTKVMVNELREKQQILEKSSEEINSLNTDLLDTMAEIIVLGDPYILGHSRRVASYATQIASLLGLQEKDSQTIRNASLLHDIGKLGVSSKILSKPSKLTADEYETVKTHVTLGADLVEKSPSLRPLVPIIRHHHEHYDGNGYPDRLKGKEIPLEARIVAASDAIEAMASNRPYRKGMPTQSIIEELMNCSGSQFDPVVVEAALKMLSAFADARVRETPSSPPSVNSVAPMKI